MSDALINKARDAATRAHAPYSNFTVGCAVEAKDGSVALGANMENACYRLGVCAEQSALAAAAQAFGLANVTRIAIAGGPREGDATGVVTPCGGCRQAIMEAAQLSGHDIEVVSAGLEGDAVQVSRISELLPSAFEL